MPVQNFLQSLFSLRTRNSGGYNEEKNDLFDIL